MMQKTIKEQNGIFLTCPSCKKDWCYKGEKTGGHDYIEYTSCPRCHGSVKVQK